MRQLYYRYLLKILDFYSMEGDFDKGKDVPALPALEFWSQYIHESQIIKRLFMKTIETDLDLYKTTPFIKDILVKGFASPNDAKSLQDRLPEDMEITTEEIQEILNNALLSFYVDRITLSILNDNPVPVEKFEEWVALLTKNGSRRDRLVGLYRDLLAKISSDTILREKNESTADVYERHSNINGASETAEIIRTLDDKENSADLKRKKTINHLKLPLVDIVFIRDAIFDQTDNGREDIRATFPQLVHFAAEGEMYFMPDAHGRYLVQICSPHLFTSEKGVGLDEMQLFELRHELRHVLSHELFANLRKKRDPEHWLIRESPLATKLAIASSTLIDEVKAICLDQRLSSQHFLKRYLEPQCLVIESYISMSKSTNKDLELFEKFKKQWDPLLEQLDLMNDGHGKPLFCSDTFKDPVLRISVLIIYHFISTAQTVRQLTDRLMIGREFILSNSEELFQAVDNAPTDQGTS
jgi:hypothetical protein